MSELRSMELGCRVGGRVGAWFLLLLLAPMASGQIVITEVMSFGATVLVGGSSLKSPDFWEMTNYGGEKVDLTGYRFNDSQGGFLAADGSPFVGMTLTPGESLLVVKSLDSGVDGKKRTMELFRELWAIPESIQVTVYPYQNGLSSFGDELRLWASPDNELMDAVAFGPGSEGRTFTRDSETGRFGVLSVLGVGGAYRAPNQLEIGSPGIAPERIPMRITRQPQSVVVNPGDAARFEIAFVGLPVPQCRWYFDTPGNVVGTGKTLKIKDVIPGDAGKYWAVIDDGVSTVTSDPVTLGLNQQATAPSFLKLAADLEMFVGQRAFFEVIATGLPRPSFQWFFEEAEIIGAVGEFLVLPEVGVGDAGRYAVVASNSMGSVTNEMQLVVGRPPRLKITEVMALSVTNRVVDGHGDWWELTNFDDHPVDLHGYRFSTMTGNSLPSLSDAWRIPNHTLIRPGESVVFVEDMSAEDFRRWWGEDNLPTDLQIVTYHGQRLGLDGALGDVLWLWNPGATTAQDYLDGVDFQGQSQPHSYAFDTEVGEFVGNSTGQSQLGVQGAIAADIGGEVGSPGRVGAVGPIVLRVARDGRGIRVRWSGHEGQKYRLETALESGVPVWRVVARLMGKEGETVDYFVSAAGGVKAFFRVVVEP